MHFEFLTEDLSGSKFLEIIVPSIIDESCNTYRIHSYKGIGRIPTGLGKSADPAKRILLDNLPRIIKGYGRTYSDPNLDFSVCIIIVCDLDRRDKRAFIEEIKQMIDSCGPIPNTVLCLAVEEGEAWLLGDKEAVISAYPNAKRQVVDGYIFDSICGTWELLANSIYVGGADSLSKQGWHAVGAAKSEWAELIGRKVQIDRNMSESFQRFVRKIRDFSDI